MTYWYIAGVFFLCSFIACNYSMWRQEKNIDFLHGSLERAGICFVVATAWPLTLTALIALVVSSMMKGVDYYD